MPTEDQVPSATAAGGSWTIVGAASLHAALADSSDASYIQRSDVNDSFQVRVPSFTFTSTSINKVTLIVRARNVAGSAELRSRVRRSNVTYTSTGQNLTSTFADYVFDWANNPSTGAPWVDAAAVNATDVSGTDGWGASLANFDPGETMQISKFTVRVDYVLTGPPGTINDLSAVAVSSTQVDLTWTAATDATSHRIERATVG